MVGGRNLKGPVRMQGDIEPQLFERWGTASPPLILRVWDGVCYERVFWVEKGVGS